MTDTTHVFAAQEDDGFVFALHETLEGAKKTIEEDWAARYSGGKHPLEWDESNPLDIRALNSAYHSTVYRISQMTVQP